MSVRTCVYVACMQVYKCVCVCIACMQVCESVWGGVVGVGVCRSVHMSMEKFCKCVRGTEYKSDVRGWRKLRMSISRVFSVGVMEEY